MKNWKDFLDSLDTPGGHIVIFLVLLSACGVVCIVFAFRGLEKYAYGVGGMMGGTLLPTLFTTLRGTQKANGRTPLLTRSTDQPPTTPETTKP